jgi:hypothetical protein
LGLNFTQAQQIVTNFIRGVLTESMNGGVVA